MIKVPATAAGVPGDRGADRAGRERQRHAAVLRRALRAGDGGLPARPRATGRNRRDAQRARVGGVVLRLAGRLQGRCAAGARLTAARKDRPIASTTAPTGALERFAEDRWEVLRSQDACPQRPLWASTGTKDPAYSDVLYVERLIAPGVVNTMPEDAAPLRGARKRRARARREPRRGRAPLGAGSGGRPRSARAHSELEREGVEAFCTSYDESCSTASAPSWTRWRGGTGIRWGL